MVMLGEREEQAVNRILSIIYGGRQMAKETAAAKADTKKCTRCGEDKPFTEFHHDKYGKSGLRSICKDCGRQDRKACVVLNFNRIPNGLEILESLRKEAGENFRDVDRQVLFTLKAVGGR